MARDILLPSSDVALGATVDWPNSAHGLVMFAHAALPLHHT
ncbi:MAG: hypothetical protein ACKOPT_02045 [Cyanobium sp.]